MSNRITCKKIASLVALLWLSLATAQAAELGDPACPSLLLVSNWTNNNVKIFDGCSGEYIRDLDSQNLIQGPLGILEAPDGDVLVVSESNDRLLKFDRGTLESGTVIMGGDTFIDAPSGAILGDDGNLYAASYGTNRIVRINTETWTVVEDILAANNGQITGIDAGMKITSDGHLIVPGYDSDNILKINVTSKTVEELVSSGANGLDAPRTILLREDQNEFYVTGERSNNVMAFNLTTGEFLRNVVTVIRPTGMMADGEEHFLVNNANAVFRYRYDGTLDGQVVANGAGGLNSGTFVYRLMKTNLDSDSDGLSDEDEINVYGTDPNNPDSDEDGLTDGAEVNTHGTNPLESDSDVDGMPDGFEVNNGLNALVDDSDGDLDADGLSNLDEFLAGTGVNNSDTDGDGVADGDDDNPLIPNSAPEINGSPDTMINEDTMYQFSPEVSYAGDINTVALSITNLPSWATFDATTGELTGTPENSDVGITTDIVITASNGYFDTSLPAFDIEVVNVNDAPSLTASIPNQTLVVGASMNLDVSAYFSDIDSGDSLTFSATNLPAAFTLSAAGVITGSSTTAQAAASVTITATDIAGSTASGNFTITVNAEEPEPSSGGGSIGYFTLLVVLMTWIRRRLNHN